jgi:excinuclease UvrABC nuclease subunit
MKKVDRLRRSKLRIQSVIEVLEDVSREPGIESITSLGERVDRNVIRGDSSMKSGIYEIRNRITGERYIGKARGLIIRRNRHFRELLANEHHCVCLQKTWNDYFQDISKYVNDLSTITPDELFEFNVIVYCRPSELTFYEHLLIQIVKPEYNTHMTDGHARARIAGVNNDTDK